MQKTHFILILITQKLLLRMRSIKNRPINNNNNASKLFTPINLTIEHL